MTTVPTQIARPDSPVGIVQPADPRAVRALKALAEHRIKDAQTNVDAIAESPLIALAWKRLLQGVVHLERRELEPALPVLVSSVSAALLAAEVVGWALPASDVVGRAVPVADVKNEGETAGMARSTSGNAPISAHSPISPTDSDALRLAALGFERIGQVRRRRDQPQAATRAHQAAYSLRCDHGSCEEIWESAVSLGIDAELAGKHIGAQEWYRAAVQLGAQATHDPAQKQAIAWTRLSALLRQTESYVEAVAAARTARDSWQKHDPGATDTARADMNLGHALLGLGESLYNQDAATPGHETPAVRPVTAVPAESPAEAQPDHATARSALQEALDRLSTARESLLPFGPATASDVQWCTDQIDFTNRLLTSLHG